MFLQPTKMTIIQAVSSSQQSDLSHSCTCVLLSCSSKKDPGIRYRYGSPLSTKKKK